MRLKHFSNITYSFLSRTSPVQTNDGWIIVDTWDDLCCHTRGSRRTISKVSIGRNWLQLGIKPENEIAGAADGILYEKIPEDTNTTIILGILSGEEVRRCSATLFYSPLLERGSKLIRRDLNSPIRSIPFEQIRRHTRLDLWESNKDK